VEEDSEAGFCNEGVSRGRGYMITGQLQVCFGKTGRGQEFLDGKMGKLYNSGLSDIEDGEKAGAN
jgi:hypothetical protein